MDDLFFEQECNAELLEMQKRKCKLKYIKNLRYFRQGCSQSYLESLADDLEPVFFGKNNTMVSEGSKFTHILMIFSGTANFWCKEMDSEHEYFESEGSLIGEIEYAEKKQKYDFTTEAVSNICAYKLEADAVKKYFETYSLQWFEMKLSAEQRRNKILQMQNSAELTAPGLRRRSSSVGNMMSEKQDSFDQDHFEEMAQRGSESMPLPDVNKYEEESEDQLPELNSEWDNNNKLLPRKVRARAVSSPIRSNRMHDYSGYEMLPSTEDWRTPRSHTPELDCSRDSVSPEGSVMRTRRMARKESMDYDQDWSNSPPHKSRQSHRRRRRRLSRERLSLDGSLTALKLAEIDSSSAGSPNSISNTSPKSDCGGVLSHRKYTNNKAGLRSSKPELPAEVCTARRPRRISSESQMVEKGLPPRPKPPAASRSKGMNMARPRTFNMKADIPPTVVPIADRIPLTER
mmetsp:Transcript_12929/g.17011  ORF Transcript_12929/g.17011 Transcript_12929/m.17011 type:complete len:459 (-) Transcript_12929:172-1548(-)